MPLGDSITDGAGSTGGGYRAPLFAKLTNAGYAFTFVGSATNNATAALTAAGQTHHEGHSGYVIQSKDPTDAGAGSGRAGIADNANAWLGAGGANPNYILLMIGTNDVDLNYFPATQGNRLSNLISLISNKTTGLRPSANLIVAKIVPTTDATENLRVVTFNNAVAAAVAQHQALGERVTMVDMYAALQPNSTDLNDKLHPTDTGYAKMADVWLAGIQAVPEPGAALAAAGAGLALLGRRKRS
jgi:lysophospholipase L1-like esterase